MYQGLNERILQAKQQNLLIRTGELTLLPLHPCDAMAVFEWMSNENVAKYMPYNAVSDIKRVEEWLQNIPQGSFDFGIFLHQDVLIGSCGLIKRQDECEVSFHFNENYWNNGYATKTVKAVVGWAASTLNAKCFCLNHVLENVASQHVAEKCGFIYERIGSLTKVDGLKKFTTKHYVLRTNSLHEMNLKLQPFESIVCGHKTIELRLNDEKRQLVKDGDYIVFNCEGRRAVVKVLQKYIFADFEKLYKKLDLTKCGYLPLEAVYASPKDMCKYYSLAKQKQHGVVGIEFELLFFD